MLKTFLHTKCVYYKFRQYSRKLRVYYILKACVNPEEIFWFENSKIILYNILNGKLKRNSRREYLNSYDLYTYIFFVVFFLPYYYILCKSIVANLYIKYARARALQRFIGFEFIRTLNLFRSPFPVILYIYI